MNSKKKDRYLFILEIFILVVLFILVTIFIIWPEYKKTIGSSDKYINTEENFSLMEWRLPQEVNFILVINQEKISNILFLTDNTYCLYNQNIEGLSLKKGFQTILKILIEEQLTTASDELTLTKYPQDTEYEKAKDELEEILPSFSLNWMIIEKNTTLEEKTQELELDIEETEELQLKRIELYSKEIIRRIKNDISNPIATQWSDDIAKQYSQEIYQKLMTYAQNVKDQEISDSNLPIQWIPASSNIEIYPTENSWYYIKDYQVYAYIELEGDHNYSYCFSGSLENVKKGKC